MKILSPGSAGGPGLPNRGPPEPLPPPRPAAAHELLAEGLAPQDCEQAFLEVFGGAVDQPIVHRDPIGERLVLGAALFQDARGRWKATKRGRGPIALLLARALLEPDEIWARLEWHHASNKAVVRRRCVARFDVEGQPVPALAVFDLGADGGRAPRRFPPRMATHYMDNLRIGVRLYRRQQ